MVQHSPRHQWWKAGQCRWNSDPRSCSRSPKLYRQVDAVLQWTHRYECNPATACQPCLHSISHINISVGVCDVCVTCGEGEVKYKWTTCWVFITCPLWTWPTVWLSPDWCCVLLQPVASQVYLLQPRQHGQHLDAANQGVSNGHSL